MRRKAIEARVDCINEVRDAKKQFDLQFKQARSLYKQSFNSRLDFTKENMKKVRIKATEDNSKKSKQTALSTTYEKAKKIRAENEL